MASSTDSGPPVSPPATDIVSPNIPPSSDSSIPISMSPVAEMVPNRLKDLPILLFEDTIMKAVEENPVVVIKSESGAGKSTQLPQMLHRRGYTNSGIVGVTQPSRVAAVIHTLKLPLEPSLSRTLMEASEHGCLSQALTVAAMLSAEITLLPGRSNNTERKHDYLDLPDGSGWGDHIQLLQIYEFWHRTDYDIDWCEDYQLQVKEMKFAKDVRRRLSQIMQKIAKGSLDVQTSKGWEESQQDYHNLRRAFCVGYANRLAKRMVYFKGYGTIGYKPQVVQVKVHPSSVLKQGDEEKLPDYVVYRNIATSRSNSPYMCTVCAVNVAWVTPILDKLKKVNVYKLSGEIGHIEEHRGRYV